MAEFESKISTSKKVTNVNDWIWTRDLKLKIVAKMVYVEIWTRDHYFKKGNKTSMVGFEPKTSYSKTALKMSIMGFELGTIKYRVRKKLTSVL